MMRSIVVGIGLAFITACAPSPDVASSRQHVANNPDGSVTMSGTVLQDEEHIVAVSVPAEATGVVVHLSGRGDADLYTQFDVPPTVEHYDCRPYVDGMNEHCVHSSEFEGGERTIYVLVRGWDPESAYEAQIVLEGIGTSPGQEPN